MQVYLEDLVVLKPRSTFVRVLLVSRSPIWLETREDWFLVSLGANTGQLFPELF
jgi:hypothetical protein